MSITDRTEAAAHERRLHEAEIEHARQVIADHEKTGDPYTGDGAEWLCVYARRRGVSDEALAAASPRNEQTGETNG